MFEWPPTVSVLRLGDSHDAAWLSGQQLAHAYELLNPRVASRSSARPMIPQLLRTPDRPVHLPRGRGRGDAVPPVVRRLRVAQCPHVHRRRGAGIERAYPQRVDAARIAQLQHVVLRIVRRVLQVDDRAAGRRHAPGIAAAGARRTQRIGQRHANGVPQIRAHARRAENDRSRRDVVLELDARGRRAVEPRPGSRCRTDPGAAPHPDRVGRAETRTPSGSRRASRTASGR